MPVHEHARVCVYTRQCMCIKLLNFILIKQAEEGVVNSGQREQVTVGSTQVMVDSRQEEEQVTVGSTQVMVDSRQEEEQVTVEKMEKVCRNT